MRLEDLVIPESPEVVQRDIPYKGDTVTAYFRIVNAETAQRLFDTLNSKGDRDWQKIRGADYRIVSAICCKEDGSDLYSEDQARKLPAPLKFQLTKAAIELITPQDEGTPKN